MALFPDIIMLERLSHTFKASETISITTRPFPTRKTRFDVSAAYIVTKEEIDHIESFLLSQ